MDTEEEENPNLRNPSPELHNESNVTTSAGTTTTPEAVTANSDTTQHELPNTVTQCENEAATDSSELHLATGDNEQPGPPSPHQAETTVTVRREDQDVVNDVIGDSLPPPPVSPEQPASEKDGVEVAGAGEETGVAKRLHLQPPEEVAVGEEEDVIRGVGTCEVVDTNEANNTEVGATVVNDDIEIKREVVADLVEGLETETGIKVTGTGAGMVDDVTDELKADAEKEETVIETALENEAVVHVPGVSQAEFASKGMDSERPLETGAVADVVEELEAEAVSEGIQMETALASKDVRNMMVELGTGTATTGIEADLPFAQVTNVVEDKIGSRKETEVVEEIKEGNLMMETEAEDEEVEKPGDDLEEELEAPEQTEMADADKEALNEAEEMEMVDEVEEVDKEEEMEVGDEMEEKRNEAEEMEEKAELEAEEVTEEVSRSAGGKRKRGKNAKTPAKATSRKKLEEDVCFICFDGGELVLCDRRGCPKAYHPSCVNRDETFFRSKGRWNCGWHLCSNCEKNAYYMCLTCTYSLCKGCIKDGALLCVRGNKGFCDTCMKTIMLIEENERGNKEMVQVDFDDKSSWEFLFKDYWVALKERLSLTSEELSQAKHPWKASELRSGKQGSPDDVYGAQNDGGSASDSSDNQESATPKRRKVKKRLKSRAKEKDSPSASAGNWDRGASDDESIQWASKELLEFVMHMKNGDKSSCSQFDVQALLLEYIKRNKLRDPRRKSQIICDSRLQNLFGKPRVGHFEMLKLLESHFLLKDDAHADDLQGSVVDMEANQLEADENSDGFVKPHKDKKRKSRKKGDKRGLQSNVDDYAAIDLHNINLIYLRRSLVEELIEDTETFNDKVVGSFVRIRISGSAQKQDLYRLVQVVGTNKAAEQYRVGKKMTNFLLEILNLNKTEVVPMDIISNQEFSEDECNRLRQSIKCGLINRLTVGDIQEKAIALQVVRVQDALETEITRVSHLRDRASDMGRRKELRECVEKLQLLKSPDERRRRLEEIPEIHTDPKMDPSYESEEDEGERDDKQQENYLRPRGSGFNRRGREPVSPHVGGASSSPNDSWGATRNYSSINRELSRNMSGKGFLIKGDNAIGATETLNENLWSQGRDRETQQLQNWEKLKPASNADNQGARSIQILDSVPRANPEISPTASSAGLTPTAAKINETDKIWRYQDPSGKTQGPFSMVQLRKWNNTGYFPADLRIWRATEKQDDSILLSDALNGKFQKEAPVETSLLKTQLDNGPQPLSLYSAHAGESRKPQTNIGNSIGQTAATPLQIPNYSADRWGGSETNLPSPTPGQTPKGGTRGKAYESRWSPTPSQPAGSLAVANALSGGSGERLRHSAVLISETDQQFSHASSSSAKLSGHLDGVNMSPGVPKAETVAHVGSGNTPQVLSQSTVPSESPRMQVNSHHHVIPGSNGPSVSVITDTRSIQKMVHPGTGNARVGSHAWEASSISRPEMSSLHPVPGSGPQIWGNLPAQKLEPSNPISSSQPIASGSWAGTTNSVHSSASPFSAGNPNSGWGSIPGNPNLGSSSFFTPENPSNAPRQGPENQNMGLAPMPGNPNVNWGGPFPANSNMGWVAPVQASAPASASANPLFVASGQGQRPGNTNQGWNAPVQGQASANAFTGWVQSSQGATPPNANQAWVAPGQGLAGNANTGWAASNSNIGQWGSDMNHHGDRFSGQKDRISHGGDSVYGAGKSWNSRQPSFGRGQRVCKFHENGHCRKGSQCDYLHP